MIDRLPVWLFLSLALSLMGFALLPIMRFALGIDAVIGIQLLTTVMFLIGGLMCGLSAMILLARRQPVLTQYSEVEDAGSTITQLHASGLLLYTGIPLANFLVCYWLWTRHRHQSALIDEQGQEALNFQITIYLYLLLALFLTLVIIGLFFIPVLLISHLVLTLTGTYQAHSKNAFHYPLNIPIIQGRATRTN